MLKDPPLLTVRRNFERVPADKVAKLKGAQTGHLTDAMNGRGALAAAIKPVDPNNAAFCGVAITCETGAHDNLAIMGALAFAKPGDVIIAASDGFTGTAVVGDNVALMAKNAGVVGIVTDGMARDQDGIDGAGVPLFSAGITPNSCVRSGPGRIGFPIVAGGVPVAAGDVVVGDRDGVVVVPAAMVDHVIGRLEGIRSAEAALQARIHAGLTQLDSIAALMASDRVLFVED
jgi:4-hydroxy-4-methyl-2-oxoglutarate aldolase